MVTALAFKASSDSLQPELTLRYDIALDRQFSRALARLLDLQSRPAPKTSAPYFPTSLAGHTWKDSWIGPFPNDSPGSLAKQTQQPIDSIQPPAEPTPLEA